MVKHLTLTLTGAVQTLSDAYATVAGVTANQAAAADLAYQLILLQPAGGNSGVVYVGGAGGDGTLSTSVYGIRLEAGVATIPAAPVQVPAPNGGPVRASDIKVLGTANDVLHALCVGA